MSTPIAVPPNPVTEADVEALLMRIKETRQQIAAAREALVPLEANLRKVADAYKKAIGPLHRRVMYLEAEISSLQAEIDHPLPEPEEEIGSSQAQKSAEGSDEMVRGPQVVQKGVLLEHAVRVLDYDINQDEGELLADIQRLCDSTRISFADILERIPWSKVWTARHSREKLADQYRRLTSWHQVLVRQLERLLQTDERRDSRYWLWLRWKEGAASWKLFIDQTTEEYGQRIETLEAVLAQKRAKSKGVAS